jgi:hypothetical protein
VDGTGLAPGSSIGTGAWRGALPADFWRSVLGDLLRKNMDITVALISGASFLQNPAFSTIYEAHCSRCGAS